jgi:hypothetical protein
MELQFSRQSWEIADIKFRENPSSGSGVVHAYEQRDTTQLILRVSQLFDRV